MKNKIVNLIRFIFYKRPKAFTAKINQIFKYTKILQHKINLEIEAYSNEQALIIAQEMILEFNTKNGSNFKLDKIISKQVKEIDSFLHLKKDELIEIQKSSFFYELENHFDYWFMNDYPRKKDKECEKLN